MATETNSYGFTIPDLDQGKEEPTFQVVSFTGSEALSTPYLFVIKLVSAAENIKNVLYKGAILTIRLGAGSVQYHGVVARFEQIRKESGYVYYEAVLKPKFDILSLTRQSDVFINLSLTDIITAVFQTAVFTDAYSLDLKGPNLNDGATFYAPPAAADSGYNRWSYCCQYEETCFDFLSRIFAREGVYYYFEQGADQEKLCITDNIISHPAPSGTILYKPPSELSTEPEDNVIHGLVYKEEMLPSRVTLMNYNYEKAGQSVMSAAAFVSGDGLMNDTYQGEVRIYGENFSTTEEGTSLAKIRAQEIFCKGETYCGFGTTVPLMPGMLINLVHTNPEFSGEYLVCDVHHQGEQKLALAGSQGTGGENFSYTNTFTLIRSNVQFRPERKTAKPRITGTMNAVIHGETSGQYAELDPCGRYQVDLPFTALAGDAGAIVMKKSAWIRMATPYAGSGATYGMHFPLHKGAEVILSFRDGDPDLPIISGAAFNSQSANPINSSGTVDGEAGVYAPQNLVIQSAGGNKIVMNDTAGEESILIHSPYPEGKGSNIYIGSSEEGEPVFSVKASGDKHEVTIGQEDDIVLGSLNIDVLGSLCEMVLGTANELHVGAFMNVELGQTIEMKGGRKFEYGDTHDKIKKEEKLLAHETVEIAAGSDAVSRAAMESVKTGAAMACAAAGAILAAAGGDIAGATDPEGTHPAREGVVAGACIATGIALQLGAYQALSALTTELANPASKLTMNDKGMTLYTLPTALNGIRIGTNVDAITGTPKTGIVIDSSSNGSVVLFSNTATDVNISLSGSDSILIEKNGCGTITVNANGVVVEYNDANAGKIEVKSDQVIIQKQGGAKLTLSDTAKLEQGSASVELTGNQIKLVGQGINAGGGALSIDAAGMVKIGG